MSLIIRIVIIIELKIHDLVASGTWQFTQKTWLV